MHAPPRVSWKRRGKKVRGDLEEQQNGTEMGLDHDDSHVC